MPEPPAAVIPVLDLMIGQIVWARHGNRDCYRPLECRITNSSQPADVAKAVFLQTGCRWLYVADIDSFAGAAPNWRVFDQLLHDGFHLMIDASWLKEERVDEAIRMIVQSGEPERIRLIVSTETISSMQQFDVLAQIIDAGISPIFSLDMQGDTVISVCEEICSGTPLELAKHAYEHGVREMILLDLQQVGTAAEATNSGDTKAAKKDENHRGKIIKEIRTQLPEMRLISGGGLGDVDDARRMLDDGCDAVLMASAIFNGSITPDEITSLSAS